MAEAAELTSFSEFLIRKFVNEGQIPAVKLGTRIAIDRERLLDWFRALPPVVATDDAETA